MKSIKNLFIISLIAFVIPVFSFAQENEAKITLNFVKEGDGNVCKAVVTSQDKPVKDVTVKLFVQRLFGLLPVGDGIATDENGVAAFNFPKDIPCDNNCKIGVIAKIEDDEKFGNVLAKGEVDWGVKREISKTEIVERSLSASRERAPIYFMVASDLIIVAIWGTLIYIIFQVFKIKRISSVNKKVIN